MQIPDDQISDIIGLRPDGTLGPVPACTREECEAFWRAHSEMSDAEIAERLNELYGAEVH